MKKISALEIRCKGKAKSEVEDEKLLLHVNYFFTIWCYATFNTYGLYGYGMVSKDHLGSIGYGTEGTSSRPSNYQLQTKPGISTYTVLQSYYEP